MHEKNLPLRVRTPETTEVIPASLNSKGYKALDQIRLIQGDGINPRSIEAILERITAAGFATDNIAFAMGSHYCSMSIAIGKSSR